MEKKLLPYLVVISALSVSLSAAFYSVSGIGKMFSGASIQVMIMMGSLEVAKLVLASLLYQYWSRLNKVLKFYYFVALFVLMSLTSAGIYGYLSSAYSETSNKLENIDKQVSVLNTKRGMFETQLNDARTEKDRINSNIAELTKAVSNNFVQTKDKDGNIITTSSSANIYPTPDWAHPRDWNELPRGRGEFTSSELYGGDIPGVEEHLDYN